MSNIRFPVQDHLWYESGWVHHDGKLYSIFNLGGITSAFLRQFEMIPQFDIQQMTQCGSFCVLMLDCVSSHLGFLWRICNSGEFPSLSMIPKRIILCGMEGISWRLCFVICRKHVCSEYNFDILSPALCKSGSFHWSEDHVPSKKEKQHWDKTRWIVGSSMWKCSNASIHDPKSNSGSLGRRNETVRQNFILRRHYQWVFQ